MNDWMPDTARTRNGSYLYDSIQTNSTITGSFIWNGQPGFDTDDGDGSAPVREPRRPRPSPLAPAAAEVEPEFCFA